MTHPTSNQCGVKGCKNTRDSGAFAGPFCAPCDHDLRTGNFEFGTSVVYEQARKIERAKRIMQRAISWLQIKEAAFTTHKGPAIIEEMQRYVGDLPVETTATPVAWRYKDSRGHWRYTGSEPKPEHTILQPEPLYTANLKTG